MKRYQFLAVFSLVFILSALAGAAEGPRWELLGRREVDFKGDRDRIDVGKREGKFSQLQIRVDGAPVEIRNMKVTFGNDETFSPGLKHRFDEQSRSRVIDLPGERRVIKRIDFNYSSPNRRAGKATVAVYGR
jgi:hypothetical protein